MTVTHSHLPSFFPHFCLCLGIRMWRILYYACSGTGVCYAALYPRGRIAGGQDLLCQCSTLSSPHGSLLWTFTAWQGSGKLSQRSIAAKTTYCTSGLNASSFISTLAAQSITGGTSVENIQALKDNLVMNIG